jgi:hypothetical protein
MFQTMALFYYHWELFCAKRGNYWYVINPLGRKQTFEDKWLCGYAVLALVIVLVVGPFFIFSDLIPGLVVDNPINKADF